MQAVAKWSRDQAGNLRVGGSINWHLKVTFDPGLPKKTSKMSPTTVYL